MASALVTHQAKKNGHPMGGHSCFEVLLREVLEALVELFDASGRVHDALLARVERVRLVRNFNVDEGGTRCRLPMSQSWNS